MLNVDKSLCRWSSITLVCLNKLGCCKGKKSGQPLLWHRNSSKLHILCVKITFLGMTSLENIENFFFTFTIYILETYHSLLHLYKTKIITKLKNKRKKAWNKKVVKTGSSFNKTFSLYTSDFRSRITPAVLLEIVLKQLFTCQLVFRQPLSYRHYPNPWQQECHIPPSYFSCPRLVQAIVLSRRSSRFQKYLQIVKYKFYQKGSAR